jgi:hypothetical protein
LPNEPAKSLEPLGYRPPVDDLPYRNAPRQGALFRAWFYAIFFATFAVVAVVGFAVGLFREDFAMMAWMSLILAIFCGLLWVALRSLRMISVGQERSPFETASEYLEQKR